jgi:alpha-L-fucosidase
MGKWMKVNGEAIYGTSATIFDTPTGTFSTTEKGRDGKPKFNPTWEWRSTTKGNKVYIEIFDWKGHFHVDKMPRKVTGAYLLADSTHKPLKFTQKGTALDVDLPAQALDPVATVLVLNTTK